MRSWIFVTIDAILAWLLLIPFGYGLFYTISAVIVSCLIPKKFIKYIDASKFEEDNMDRT